MYNTARRERRLIPPQKEQKKAVTVKPGIMAEEKDKLHIRLHVYDTEIPVNIKREDEFFYRQAAKLISSTVNTYSDIFKNRKSEKEILYFAMVDIALRYEKNKDNNDTGVYDDILKKLTQEIEEAL